MSRIIRGDSFGPVGLWTVETSPLNLTDSIIEVQVHTLDYKFSQTLVCNVLDQTIPTNVGKFSIVPVSTETWPLGEIVLKISRTTSGVKTSMKTSYMVGL